MLTLAYVLEKEIVAMGASQVSCEWLDTIKTTGDTSERG